MEQHASVFASIDTDNSGTITPDELIKAMLFRGMDDREISELFRKKTKMERKIRKLQEWRRDNGGSMYPPTTSNSSSNSPSQASTAAAQ